MRYGTLSLRERLFVALQYLLPQHLLSRALGTVASSRLQPLKDFLIRRFIAAFAVDMSEAAEPDPGAYEHFNAFFTRALRPGARRVDSAAQAIVSPADGVVSQVGAIEDGRIFQAKGHWFGTSELLADTTDARLFEAGSFVTIYLSPRDYHRVHMPRAATLRALRHVPGRLFSVNRITAESVPALFARNERLVCLFDTEHGPMAMVLVGAMVVAGIETVWTGPVAPAGRQVLTLDFTMDAAARALDKGAEMGRFQLGSTVVLLYSRGAATWEEALAAGTPLRMGQRIGTVDA